MFCNQCGKQISDQSKFCNYCGAQVYNAPPAGNHIPTMETPAAGNRVSPRETPAAQKTAPSKKRGGFGKSLLTIAIAVLVFFGARFAAEWFITGGSSQSIVPESNTQGIILNKRDSSFDLTDNAATFKNSDIEDAFDSCSRGSIYENGYLRYGMSRLHMPGYLLLSGDGDDRDWLISSDNALMFTAYQQKEIIDVSFDASDEAGMLDSYRQTYGDSEMIDFQKYYVNGFPVIRYVVAYTSGGVYQYQGELIIFPRETTDETIRLTMFVDIASGYGLSDIDQIFNTLDVSPVYRVTEKDTNVIGFNRITVK